MHSARVQTYQAIREGVWEILARQEDLHARLDRMETFGNSGAYTNPNEAEEIRLAVARDEQAVAHYRASESIREAAQAIFDHWWTPTPINGAGIRTFERHGSVILPRD
jgi:hypothetical protein